MTDPGCCALNFDSTSYELGSDPQPTRIPSETIRASEQVFVFTERQSSAIGAWHVSFRSRTPRDLTPEPRRNPRRAPVRSRASLGIIVTLAPHVHPIHQQPKSKCRRQLWEGTGPL